MRSHRHQFRVIYGDTDMMGVVYYANYLRYFEAGRNEFLRDAGFDYASFERLGLILPVTEAKAKYLSPARYDDELSLTTTLAQLRFGSLRMSYELMREADGAKIATGETIHACVDGEGRVRRLPDSFRAVLEAEGSRA